MCTKTNMVVQKEYMNVKTARNVHIERNAARDLPVIEL